MGKKVFLVCLLFPIIVACSSSQSDIVSEKTVKYIKDDGTEIDAQRISAPNGKYYYVVRIDSVTYQQALLLQKDGWVLPRMFGAQATDEHRYTTMPTFEMLLKSPNNKRDADWDDFNNPIKVPESEMKALLDKSNNSSQFFWTATRIPNKEKVLNYVLNYHSDSESYLYKMSEYKTISSTFLFKDAQLVDEEIPDSIYLTLDGKRKEACRYFGADGYEYYVVYGADSLCTWYDAIAMEKDGWLLPRTEGWYFQSSAPAKLHRTIDRWRLHFGGLEPSIEGITGHHPLSSQDGISKRFQSVFPFHSWLGTPNGLSEAFMLGNIIIEELKQRKAGAACLVKRIQPTRQDIKYNMDNGILIQPQVVRGKSGIAYYVVDPTNWLCFPHTLEEAENTERKKWHIIRIEELADILGIDDNLDRTSVLRQYDNERFYDLFPRNGTGFYVRDVDDDLIVFEPYYAHYAQPEWGLRFYEKYYRGASVRLVYSEREEETINMKYSDPQMYALKGNVHNVTIEPHNVGEWSGDYHATNSKGVGKTEMSFNKHGQILKDHLGNVYLYAENGDFKKGNNGYTKVERDKSNRVILYNDSKEEDDEANFQVHFNYNGQGNIVKIEYSGWTEAFTVTYNYNTEGQLLSKKTEGTYEGGGAYTIECKYRYKEFDEQGNWKERVVTQTSTNVEESEEEPSTTEDIYIDIQTIRYY